MSGIENLDHVYYVRRVLFFLTLLIPIYFIILLNLTPVQLVVFDDPLLNWLLSWIGVPLLFSLPWIFIIYTLRDEIVTSIHVMGRETTLLPLKWRVFYGFNAAMLLSLLILPFFSPFLLVLSSLLVIGRFLGRVNPEGSSNRRLGILFIFLSILIVLPIIWFIVIFFSQYIAFFLWLLQLWFFQVDNIYTVSTLIINTVTIGSLLWVLAEKIYEEDIKLLSLPFSSLPSRRIQVFEILIFIVLFVLWIPSLGNQGWILDYVSQISLIVVVLVFLYRKIAKLPKSTTQPGLIGMVWVIVFLLIYLLDFLSPIRPIVVILAGSAMCFVFLKSVISSLQTKS
ncbi:MAG: hypothetical protein ACXACA_05345 [Candidatus Ranarchaeia archaeon]